MYLVFNFPSNQVSTIILTSIIDSLLNNFLSSHIYLSRKHRRGWEGAAPEFDAGCSYQHHCPRIGAMSECFFFFFLDLSQLGSNLRQLGFNSHQFRPIRPESSCIDQIGSYQSAAETDRNG